MCKKLLSSLMGGGEKPKTPAAPVDAGKGVDNSTIVKETGDAEAVRGSGLTGLGEDKRKRTGVPGLAL